jgi:hypothetical protein
VIKRQIEEVSAAMAEVDKPTAITIALAIFNNLGLFILYLFPEVFQKEPMYF